MRFRAVVATASVLAFSVAITDAAFAACTRLSFSVNDYGKDGPTKDAKDLLDKYAAKWTSDRGIKKFAVGPKEVSCALFLNFIVFDEHTCTATANVCWEGNMPAAIKDAKADAPFVNKAAVAQPKATTAAPAAGGAAVAPVATGSVKAAPATPKPAAAKAPATPAKVAPSAATVVTPSASPASVVPTATTAAPAATKAPVAATPPETAPTATGTTGGN